MSTDTPETDEIWREYWKEFPQEENRTSTRERMFFESKLKKLERKNSRLERECIRLQEWKESAMEVFRKWEAAWEAAGKPGRLGSSKADSMKEYILSNGKSSQSGGLG